MHKNKTGALKLLLIPSVVCLFISVAVNAQPGPDLFNYQELVQLYEQETASDALQTKLHRLLTIPFVSNAATARRVKPLCPRTPKLGSFLRVVEWNIERGGSSERKLILQQISLMKQADVRLQPFEHQPHDW